MKTKEIDVYVAEYRSIYDITVFNINDEGLTPQYIKDHGLLKAKLIIEIPEKKVEITYSELKRGIDGAIDSGINIEDYASFLKGYLAL